MKAVMTDPKMNGDSQWVIVWVLPAEGESNGNGPVFSGIGLDSESARADAFRTLRSFRTPRGNTTADAFLNQLEVQLQGGA